MSPPPVEGKVLALRVAAGLAAFALGAALALALLPEWRAGEPAEREHFVREFRRIAGLSGFRLPPGQEPAVNLAAAETDLAEAYRSLGEEAAHGLATARTALFVRVSQSVRRPGLPEGEELHVDFSLDGYARSITWEHLSAPLFQAGDLKRLEAMAEGFARRLLQPGESFDASLRGHLTSASTWEMRNVSGSRPAEYVLAGVSAPQTAFASRGFGRIGDPGVLPHDNVRRVLLSGLIVVPIAIAVAGLFFALLLRARIDLVNGALLSLIALLSASPRWLFKYLSASPWLTAMGWLFQAPGAALAIFLAWSAGESLLRSARPDFTTSLDTLRRGRLGPRGGRALLTGFAWGAGLAGLRLALYALAVPVPGLSPAGPSLDVPPFRIQGSPVSEGIFLAAGVALALALGLRLLPPRWAPWVAALLAGFVLTPVDLLPWAAELAVNVGFAGLLVRICHRSGLTALLAAAVVSMLLPTALFAARYADWMPVTLPLTMALAGGLLALGFACISRPETVDAGSVPPPAFMRRLAEERRLQHEVDLLARMQVGLLPLEMPRMPGWEVAARSDLASEAGGDLYDFLYDDAGRLWIAAGDVAGHGYSCAVLQAMVKAGLLSLMSPEESPAGVLQQLDRVIRGVGAEHSFTSLALVVLDPATGEAVLSNAGHPYPLLIVDRKAEEIALPGLPLGRGPARVYGNRPFHLPPGSVLALCSDGVFEGLDRSGNAYGFDRAREVLRVMAHRPALEIVDALLNDCRRHLGDEEAPDDRTVVVVKRG